MKRLTLIILAFAAILAGSVSCQKINDIDKRLTELEQTVSDLKAQILAGAVINSVDKTSDGCTFTLSNGQTFTVTNGEDGTDGEAIIADVKIEDNFVVLTLKNGEILRISYQNPLSMVTLNIVPDYADGAVKNYSPATNCMYLSIEVTPPKYAETLTDTSRFIHKAVFSPVQTKAGFNDAFTIAPSSISYYQNATIPYFELCLELDEETARRLDNVAYAVSYSIEDKDGIHGVSAPFVPIYSKATSGSGESEKMIPPLIVE